MMLRQMNDFVNGDAAISDSKIERALEIRQWWRSNIWFQRLKFVDGGDAAISDSKIEQALEIWQWWCSNIWFQIERLKFVDGGDAAISESKIERLVQEAEKMRALLNKMSH